MKISLPWKIKFLINFIRNIYFYYKNKLYHFFNKNKYGKLKIMFLCGFHGKTGGLYAIANIANLLSNKYSVFFKTFLYSNYNSVLSPSVKLKNCLDLNCDLYICDVTYDTEKLEKLRINNKRTIITCHGFRDRSHGLTEDRVMKSLSTAEKVHFVNYVQQESFRLEEDKYFIIPNITEKISKDTVTNNVGIIGNADDLRKNIIFSTEVALLSNAKEIHLWGGGAKKNPRNKRIVKHEFEINKLRIYNSFDVLVSLSNDETFGLIVIEAMSAGIPCLLSDIPAHRSFSNCPGILIFNPEEGINNAVEKINKLLAEKLELKNKLIIYWKKNYSFLSALEQWMQVIDDISGIGYNK